jgi:hypothetical protein
LDLTVLEEVLAVMKPEENHTEGPEDIYSSSDDDENDEQVFHPVLPLMGCKAKRQFGSLGWSIIKKF